MSKIYHSHTKSLQQDRLTFPLVNLLDWNQKTCPLDETFKDPLPYSKVFLPEIKRSKINASQPNILKTDLKAPSNANFYISSVNPGPKSHIKSHYLLNRILMKPQDVSTEQISHVSNFQTEISNNSLQDSSIRLLARLEQRRRKKQSISTLNTSPPKNETSFFKPRKEDSDTKNAIIIKNGVCFDHSIIPEGKKIQRERSRFQLKDRGKNLKSFGSFEDYLRVHQYTKYLKNMQCDIDESFPRANEKPLLND